MGNDLPILRNLTRLITHFGNDVIPSESSNAFNVITPLLMRHIYSWHTEPLPWISLRDVLEKAFGSLREVEILQVDEPGVKAAVVGLRMVDGLDFEAEVWIKELERGVQSALAQDQGPLTPMRNFQRSASPSPGVQLKPEAVMSSKKRGKQRAREASVDSAFVDVSDDEDMGMDNLALDDTNDDTNVDDRYDCQSMNQDGEEEEDNQTPTPESPPPRMITRFYGASLSSSSSFAPSSSLPLSPRDSQTLLANAPLGPATACSLGVSESDGVSLEPGYGYDSDMEEGDEHRRAAAVLRDSEIAGTPRTPAFEEDEPVPTPKELGVAPVAKPLKKRKRGSGLSMPKPKKSKKEDRPTYVWYIADALTHFPDKSGTLRDICQYLKQHHPGYGNPDGVDTAVRSHYGIEKIGGGGGVAGIAERWKLRKGWEEHCLAGLQSHRDEDGKWPQLWCICQKPHGMLGGDMIPCIRREKCKVDGGWYHLKCVGLTNAFSKEEEKKWLCPSCKSQK